MAKYLANQAAPLMATLTREQKRIARRLFASVKAQI
jgi:hypothetical protein